MNFQYCNMIVVPIPKLLRCARSPDCAKLLRLRGACPGLGSNCKRRQSLSLWYSKGKIVLHLFLGLVWDILHMFWDASQIIENSLGWCWWVPVMSRRVDQQASSLLSIVRCSSSRRRPWTACSTICDGWLRSSPICLLQDPGCCLLETRFITSRWGSQSGDP